METFELVPHPAHPSFCLQGISARLLAFDAYWLTLRFSLAGARAVVLPPLAGKGRADGLWRTTCFELFVAGADPGGGYAEFNLSPSERWAAYDFTGYREGMADRAMPRDPVCTARRGGGTLIFDVAIPRAALPPLPWRYGLSAVIEEAGGVISYWAIAHRPDKPDFHHPACFAATLAAPDCA
ncbi:DOMON-like domain-containing protein [Novosphingobium sp. FKTRR1]|uniref:DOMON-like domain-containing protein n=1 Tax=Novosphingobium sp. FKTRR1 TaxID=2879118 RepID=UPI001CF0B95B|nr:DOMON-like domain-containing protein [Novosphingobium sp. FKTRR1]